MAERFVWQFFSYFGDIAYWLGFSISFLLIYPLLTKEDKAKTKWILLDLIPIVLISYLLVSALKFLFLVPRPCFGLETCPVTPSFPSGHAAIAFASATIIVVKLKKWKYFLFFGLAGLVALSRIMVGVHSVLDVVAGSILGVFIGVIGMAARKVELSWFYRRKAIHLLSILILPLEIFLGKVAVATLIALISLFYLISEVLRVQAIKFPLLQEITKACCEQKKMKGIEKTPLYLAAGILLLLLAFPRHAFYSGAIAVIIGDFMAGIFGTKFGRRKIPYNRRKTLEGSMACFCSTFLSYLLLINIFSALIIATFATLIESLFVKYENFILPISVGIFSLFIYL